MGLWPRIMLLLKIRSHAALDAAEDPSEVFDYAWREQQELRGFNSLADVPGEKLAGESARLHHYQNAADQHPDVDLHYVVLRPERETALARAQQRTEPGALLDAGPILDLWHQFDGLGDLSRHAVDTTHFDAEEAAEVVYQELVSNRMRLPSAHRNG